MITKYQTRFDGFDEQIISMYARGMSTREIEGHLREIYGVDVSPALVSKITEAVQVKCGSGRAGRWIASIRFYSWTH